MTFAGAGRQRADQSAALPAERGRGLSHAYLISGPAGSGGTPWPRLLAAAMVCYRPPGRAALRPVRPLQKGPPGHPPGRDGLPAPGRGSPSRWIRSGSCAPTPISAPTRGSGRSIWLEGADQMSPSRPERHAQAAGGGPALRRLSAAGGEPRGAAPDGALPVRGAGPGPVSPAECEQWLRARFPQKDPGGDRAGPPGLPGHPGPGGGGAGGRRRPAGSRRSGPGSWPRPGAGDELALLEAAQALEKAGREELVRPAGRPGDGPGGAAAPGRRPPAARCGPPELVRQLRQAAQLNANPGQLAGWLCAGLFSTIRNWTEK